MKNIEKIKEICLSRISSDSLNNNYLDRLNEEIGDLELWLNHSDFNMGKYLLLRRDHQEKPRKTNQSGSVINYLLGLTSLDPIAEKLKVRKKILVHGDCPDIDTDFDPRYKDNVKDNIVREFGEEKVCSIGSYQTFKTKAVLQDIARTLGYDVHEAEKITKLMDTLKGHDVTVTDENGEETIVEKKLDKMTWEEIGTIYPKAKIYFEKHPEILHHADFLRNQISNMSTHAGGIIISNLNLQECIPVLKDHNGRIVATWTEGISGHELSAVGLVKFDILGLNNLSIIDECLKMLESNQNIKMGINDIPINDKEAIKHGSKEDLMGIFQLESPSTKPVSDAVKMESINDISAVTSLIRPGPKNMGMHMEYAYRKNGQPFDMIKGCDDILGETYGVMVYQEQVMNLSKRLAGFTGVEANKLRKGLGKKIPEIVESFRIKFVDGCEKVGLVDRKEANKIFEEIESFASYGFNKSHAISYSAITSQELWLKHNYPIEYITALLNTTARDREKSFSNEKTLITYIGYAMQRGFDVLPPDINKSEVDATIEEDNIRFSLKHIKGVKNSATIIQERQPYTDFEDFYKRINKNKVNKGVMISLIASGAFSEWGTRNEMLNKLYSLRKDTRIKKYIAGRKTAVADDVDFDSIKSINNEEILKMTEEDWEELEEEVLGLCLSKEPLLTIWDDYITKNRYDRIRDLGRVRKAECFGKIKNIEERLAKSGNKMLFVSLTDEVYSTDFFVFEKDITNFQKRFKLGDVAIVGLGCFDGKAEEMRFFDANIGRNNKVR